MKNHRDFAVIDEVELGMKIDILGVTYEVLEIHTPDSYDERGLHNVARRARDNRVTADLVCARLRGSVLHQLQVTKPLGTRHIVTYCMKLLTADKAYLDTKRAAFRGSLKKARETSSNGR